VRRHSGAMGDMSFGGKKRAPLPVVSETCVHRAPQCRPLRAGGELAFLVQQARVAFGHHPRPSIGGDSDFRASISAGGKVIGVAGSATNARC